MHHIYMGAFKLKDIKRRAEYLGNKLFCVQNPAPIRATFLPVASCGTESRLMRGHF